MLATIKNSRKYANINSGMVISTYQPIYDITKTFEENLKNGPSKGYKSSLKEPSLKGDFRLLGYKINSPFGASACPTGSDSRYIKAMFDNGYDIVVTKTRRSVHFSPHGLPNVVHIVPGKIVPQHMFEELPPRESVPFSDYKNLTVVNSFGNNSTDPAFWQPDAVKANRAVPKGKLLITSIVGTIQKGFTEQDYCKDFAKTALLAKKSGAKAIEINLSCPNVANEGVLCYDDKAVLEICKLVKKAVGKTPVVVKLAYFTLPQQILLEDMMKSISPYIAAVSAINSTAIPVLDENGQQLLPGNGRLKAGLSGHPIKELGLDMTKRLHVIREEKGLNYEIIGIGGVLTPKDFLQYREAGADAVLSAAGAMWNPDLANSVKYTLL